MATSTKNSDENTEVTEAPEAEVETKQVLFKVPRDMRDQLKMVAVLEGNDGLQDLFATISAGLVEKHAEALAVIFAATRKAA